MAFNYQKTLLWWSTNLYTNFQATLISSLPCRLDRTLTWIVTNSILNIYQIHTKLDMEICLHMLFICTKFQVWIYCFVTIFEKCVKLIPEGPPPSRKKKETKKFAFTHIWGMLREIFFKPETWPGGYHHCKLLAIQIRHHGASDSISEHVAFCLLVCGRKNPKNSFSSCFVKNWISQINGHTYIAEIRITIMVI